MKPEKTDEEIYSNFVEGKFFNGFKGVVCVTVFNGTLYKADTEADLETLIPIEFHGKYVVHYPNGE